MGFHLQKPHNLFWGNYGVFANENPIICPFSFGKNPIFEIWKEILEFLLGIWRFLGNFANENGKLWGFAGNYGVFSKWNRIMGFFCNFCKWKKRKSRISAVEGSISLEIAIFKNSDFSNFLGLKIENGDFCKWKSKIMGFSFAKTP